MEHDDIKNKIAAIVAAAPDQIGAVVFWPAGRGQMLGALLDTKMQLIHDTTPLQPCTNLFRILSSLHGSAVLIRRAFEADEENHVLARAANDAQMFNGQNAREKA